MSIKCYQFKWYWVILKKNQYATVVIITLYRCLESGFRAHLKRIHTYFFFFFLKGLACLISSTITRHSNTHLWSKLFLVLWRKEFHTTPFYHYSDFEVSKYKVFYCNWNVIAGTPSHCCYFKPFLTVLASQRYQCYYCL